MSTKKKILKATLLPGLFPRVKDLLGGGLSNVAYLLSLVFNAVRILPNNHAYLQKDHIGTYTMLQAIGAASHHVKLNKQNLDQVFIFFTILSGLMLFVMQVLSAGVALFISTANAQVSLPTTVRGFFTTPNPDKDLSYQIMDNVFGIPGLFNLAEGDITPLQAGLHAMFEFYSLGMVGVGAIIIIYFIITLVGETARTGVPFGQRSNKTWMAPRVVLFFGLLIPISYGINGGQYITLYAAKTGSLLASSGWTLFHEKIEENTSTLAGRKEQMVAIPTATDVSNIPSFMLIAKTCQKAYQHIWNQTDFQTGASKISEKWDADGAKSWLVYKTPPPLPEGAAGDFPNCNTTQTGKYSSVELTTQSYQDITACSRGDFNIVFGIHDPAAFPNYQGGVLPICGSLIMRTLDLSEPGPALIQDGYLDLVKKIWEGSMNDIDMHAENWVKSIMNIGGNSTAPPPNKAYIEKWIKELDEFLNEPENGLLARGVREQIEKGDWQMPERISDYGWVGAGVWYSKIAEQNGALVSAVRFAPTAALYPKVQEEIKEAKKRDSTTLDEKDVFSLAQGTQNAYINFDIPRERDIAMTLNEVYKYWNGSSFRAEKQVTGNIFIDTVNLIFGTYGLFDLCANADVHPLAQLSAVGKSMIDSAVRSFAFAGLTGIGSIFAGGFGPALGAMSSFFGKIAGIGLLVGFILFYVIPFMPFIYFFFAVAAWVKTIFEAMVAMPLWALAHLRIDGEGIPGDAAIQGYYLIFEIFIRPLLIIFGLIASITIFAAMVKALNEIFYLVVSNLSGHDPKANQVCFQDPNAPTSTGPLPGNADGTAGVYDGRPSEPDLKNAYRGPIDEFFFTILYAIIVYMIAQTTFKLVDLIPKQILRWLGAEISTFLDEREDPAAGLVGYLTIGGSTFGSQLGDSAAGVGKGVKDSYNSFRNANKPPPGPPPEAPPG